MIYNRIYSSIYSPNCQVSILSHMVEEVSDLELESESLQIMHIVDEESEII